MSCWLLVFQVTTLAFVLGDPVWHLTAFPLFGIVSLALIVGSESVAEWAFKLASIVIALAIQAGLQTYVALYWTLENTARGKLAQEYAPISRGAASAGSSAATRSSSRSGPC